MGAEAANNSVQAHPAGGVAQEELRAELAALYTKMEQLKVWRFEHHKALKPDELNGMRARSLPPTAVHAAHRTQRWRAARRGPRRASACRA
jgi:hypothetical protein